MKLNKKILKELNACEDGYAWYLKNGMPTVEETLLKLIDYKVEWAYWLMQKTLSKDNLARIAIFAAELVIHIYAEKYPNDDRPQKAIEAAKEYLKNKNEVSLKAAANAAEYAAYAAANAAAKAASYAAYEAAKAAAYAAAYAASAAAYAAYAAAAYAAVAYEAASAKKDIQLKIITEVIRLINKQDGLLEG